MYWIKKRATNKHRWKRKALAALYLIFLLAEAGEFFVSSEAKQVHYDYKVETRVEEEIPEHLPEKPDESSLKINKDKGKDKPIRRFINARYTNG